MDLPRPGPSLKWSNRLLDNCRGGPTLLPITKLKGPYSYGSGTADMNSLESSAGPYSQ